MLDNSIVSVRKLPVIEDPEELAQAINSIVQELCYHISACRGDAYDNSLEGVMEQVADDNTTERFRSAFAYGGPNAANQGSEQVAAAPLVWDWITIPPNDPIDTSDYTGYVSWGAAATTREMLNITIPTNFSYGNAAELYIYYSVGTAGGAGDVVRFIYNYSQYQEGTSPTYNYDSGITVSINGYATGNMYRLKLCGIVPGANDSGTMLSIRVGREPGHASDTYTGVIKYRGAVIAYKTVGVGSVASLDSY